MTPAIAEMVKRVGFDPASYTWMDLSVLPEDFNATKLLAEDGVLDKKMYLDKLHFPFPNTALVSNKEEATVITISTRNTGEIVVETWGQETVPVGVWTPENGFKMHPTWEESAKKNPHLFDTPEVFGEIIASRISVLEALMLYAAKKGSVVHGHKCLSTRASNIKRMKKGKKLLYEWSTVEIKPAIHVDKSTETGRTHETPRLHEVRGHWAVRKKSGKRYWVKSHKRGDPTKGAVFHDYTTGEAQ
jgi:hypothetical protein